MRIEIVSVSAKQPAWVNEAFDHYAKRFKGGSALSLRELPLGRRGPSMPLARAVGQEGEKMLSATARADRRIALDERGRSLDTAELARRLEDWARVGSTVALMVGGPDGLSPACLDAADECWSLSALTLPHGLVRVIAAEALYRAWSLNRGHPYHRA